MSNKFITATGTVIEACGYGIFKVALESGHTITCVISGKMRLHSIRVMVGDLVTLEMSPFDLTKGRIVKRN